MAATIELAETPMVPIKRNGKNATTTVSIKNCMVQPPRRPNLEYRAGNMTLVSCFGMSCDMLAVILASNKKPKNHSAKNTTTKSPTAGRK